jgi:hypothetical protein
MPSAKFITQDENSENKHMCNICCEQIDSDKIVGLGCNPNKHIFCYQCITDWYNEIKIKKKTNIYHSNYTIITMCPICRENGGLLPLAKNTAYVKGIHIVNYNNIIKTNKINKNESTPIVLCGVKLSTKNGFCSALGKTEHGGVCGRHKNSKKPEVLLGNINQNIDVVLIV